MLTITIGARSLMVAFAAIAAVLGLYATHTLVSGSSPEQYIKGDINCDGVVDGHDALGALRHTGGLSVPQNEPCPDVGTLAAIPGPQGPEGLQGPAGPKGDPGINLFANVAGDGTLEGGNATGVARTFDGVYEVTFAEDISACAAVANPGSTGAGMFFPRAIAATNVAPSNVNTIRVGFQDHTSAGHDTDFHLIVVC